MSHDFRRDAEREKEMERRRNSKREIRRRQEMEERDKFVEEKEFKPITEDQGVQKRIIQMGLGENAEKGYMIDCHIEGRLLDGTIFFNTIKDGNQMSSPVKIYALRRDVVKGVDMGLLTMKQNEIAEFKLKPEYAYGEKGNGNLVPPNTEVIIKVDIRNMCEPDIKPTQMTTKQRIERSEKLKAKGIQDFKDDEYKDAIRKFDAAYKLVTFMDDEEEYSKENVDRIVSLLCNKSNCLNKLEKYDESIKNIEFAIEIKPEHAKSYYYRGVSI